MNPLLGMMIFFLMGLAMAGIAVWTSNRQGVNTKQLQLSQDDGMLFLAHFALGTIIYFLLFLLTHLDDLADGCYVVAMFGASLAFYRWLEDQRLLQAIINFCGTLAGCIPIYWIAQTALN